MSVSQMIVSIDAGLLLNIQAHVNQKALDLKNTGHGPNTIEITQHLQ